VIPHPANDHLLLCPDGVMVIPMPSEEILPVTIRPANADDELDLWKLAALDSSPLPAAPLLVAEIQGELRAAVSVTDLRAIADPFRRTAELVELLRQTATTIAPWPRSTRRPDGSTFSLERRRQSWSSVPLPRFSSARP
ncbi:MAG TPA: hypothetical protein VKU35_00345, partial [Candidatus Limnocylindria bacterium]|nr:hypothetical protein [Candidatus Limnocylindria bacterium]